MDPMGSSIPWHQGPPNMYPHPLFTGPPLLNSNPPALAGYYPFNSDPQLTLLPKLNVPFGGVSTSQDESVGIGAESSKRKRGRPRKYVSDNNAGTDLASNSASCAPVMPNNQESPTFGSPNSNPPVKRGRGRPLGSVKKKMPETGSSGNGFVPQLLYVEEGEDILAKLYAFSQEGGQTVSVITISGAVSNVTIVQPPLSGSTKTYEGPLQILSLSGTFSHSEAETSTNQKSTISVTFAGTESQVLGGEVSGKLMAATQIQVLLLAGFVVEAKNTKPEISPFPSNEVNGVAPARVANESPASECPSSASHENIDTNGFSLANITDHVYDMGAYSNTNWS